MDHPRYDGSAVIIGAGSVGSFLAAKLAKAGFRRLYLLDRDVLEEKNSPRHFLDVDRNNNGKPKAIELARRLTSESCLVEGEYRDFLGLSEDEQIAYLSQAGVVIAATDSPECQLRINELCVRLGIPAVYPGIGIWPDEIVRHGEIGHILPVIPGEGTPCFQCYTGWRPQEDTGDEAVPGRGGAGLDIDYFAGIVAWAIIGLFHPDDPHAAIFNPARPLTLVHSLSSVSSSVREYFEQGNVANLELPFPRARCPVCGGQEIPPSLPPSPPSQPVPPPRPIPSPAPTPQHSQPLRDANNLWLVRRISWFLAMIAALLILARLGSSLRPTSNPLLIVLAALLLAAIAYGLYRTFRPPTREDARDPQLTWGGVALSIALLVISIVILTYHNGSPAQAAPAQQPAATPDQGGSESPAVQPSGSPDHGSSAPARSTSSPSPTAPQLPLGWSSGQLVDNNDSYLTSVSCPTTRFCMATDNTGYAYTFSNGTWSKGQQISTSGGGFASVSCPSESFCAAATSGPTVYMYGNGTWSSTAVNGAQLIAVSCPTDGYCIAVSSNNAYIYANGNWNNGTIVEQQNNLTSLSCPTKNFCMATDDGGNVYEYSDGGWSSGQQVDNSGDGLHAVSCPTTRFCALTALGNTVYVGSGGSWSSSQLIAADGATANLNALSCPTDGYCVAMGNLDSYVYDHGAWANGHVVQQQFAFVAISCANQSFCMAVDNDGNAYSYSSG